MTSLLVVVALLLGQRGLQPGTGIVKGSIRVDGGGSAAGVRVAAMAPDDPTGTNLLSLGETDNAGRYQLSNLPEGRYYIVAGRLSNFTYYPGGPDPAKAALVTVEPARVTTGIDFVVPSGSKRPPSPLPATLSSPSRISNAQEN